MLEDSRVFYSVPTHLQEREPFAFGRTVGEIAKLVAIGVVVVQILTSNDLAAGVRWPAAGLLLLIGAGWALVRIQRRPLDWWLELVFRYGVRPRRQVWRSRGGAVKELAVGDAEEDCHGWYELQQVRLRWADRVVVDSCSRNCGGQSSDGVAGSA